MFTPFIQYAWESSKTLDIVAVEGYLGQSSAGTWGLTDAGDPVVSKTEAASSAALTAPAAGPSGHRQYRLLGVRFFNPSRWKAQKVAVRGVLIGVGCEGCLNVTSLQIVAPACKRPL